MINFYELFNSIFINDFMFTFGIFIISLGIIFIIFFLVLGIIFDFLDGFFDFSIRNTIFIIIIFVISTFFIIRAMEKRSKDKFYKITKINHLNINYEKFISENKKLKDFCININEERKYLLYSKYDNDFCKIEESTGNVDINTANDVFNELYSTSENKSEEKNEEIEKAIKFIKGNEIQIKVNNKKKGEKND